MSDDLNVQPDLTDPAVLLDECRTLATGMAQQAESVTPGNSTGGHPYPGFFYGKVSRCLEAAAAVIATMVAPKSEPAPAGGESGPPPVKAKK